MARTFSAATLEAAVRPTFYFIGVTTGASGIRAVFPRWAAVLGLGDVELVGIDLPLHAPAAEYRTVARFLKSDPLSLGALVTTHKLDLFRAARDLFDEADPLAELMGEVSCLSKRDGRFRAHAKDPISSGLALDAILGAGYFNRHEAGVVLFGAGGSAIAIDWYLTRPERGDDRPRTVTVTNRSEERLRAIRRVHSTAGGDVPLMTLEASSDAVNDDVLLDAPPASLIVNATGLGKDAPGSPLSAAASFPTGAIAWDLNYRGDLVFLDQAKSARFRGVRAEDGWTYFIHGWMQVIAEVFDIAIPTSGPRFDQLSALAAETRR